MPYLPCPTLDLLGILHYTAFFLENWILIVLQRISFWSYFYLLKGNDLKVTLDFKIVHPSNDTPEMKFLHNIVLAKKIELLKHPICESFLHMKWIQVKKYFYTYFVMYLLFLLSFNVMVFLDLSTSSIFKGKPFPL